MDKRFYRPELDIVRLLAFLSVFLHHTISRDPAHGRLLATIVDSAGFGLPLFFVLSAYLITTLLLREVQSTGTVAIGRFYKRRILRIWPLYLLALLYGCLSSLHRGTFHVEKLWFVAALCMLGNLSMLPGTAVGHLWSISVEEQFYLIWPSLMRRLSRRGLILAAGVFIAAANAMLVYYGLAHTPVDRVIWQNTFVQFEMFAAGILLAIFTSTEDTWLTSPIARSAFAASVPIIWVITESCTHIKLRTQNAMGPVSLCMGYALIASSCALLIYAFLGSNNWPKWLVHMGKVSYGLYVFHVSAIKAISHITLLTSFWAREILTLAVISTLALLSYRFFETPFLKMKQRLEVIPSRPVEID